MKNTRHRARFVSIASIAACSALALTACGSSSGGGTNAGGSTAPSSGSASAGPDNCASGDLSGQGSTFQQNAQLQWIADYQKKCSGAKVAYQGTGSGAGKAAFGNGTADFGGTDSLPKDNEQAAADKVCSPGKGIVTPIVAGAAVITFNLKGVDSLTLSPQVVAGIFERKITTWDDPAIKKINDGVNLPSIPIVPVHRTDKSGTTNIFTSWLAADAGGDWSLGAGEVVNWPGGEQSAKGSDGVTTVVKQTDGGVTYTELSFAKQRNLPDAMIVNQAGKAVKADSKSVSAALETAKVDMSKGDLRVTPDYATSNPDAFPMASPTFILTCDKGNKNAALLKGYFTYALTDGQGVLDMLGYAPLPDSLNKKALDQIKSFS